MDYTKLSAYWLDPKGNIHEVKTTHINFLRDNLELFKMTIEDYRETYIKHKEKFGFEGKAREEILINAMKRGWVRIRNYYDKGWSVEAWELDKFTTSNIFKWAAKVKKLLEGMQFDKVNIHVIRLEKENKPQSKWLITISLDEIIKGGLLENKQIKMKTFKQFLNEENFHDKFKTKKKWFELSGKLAQDFADDFFELLNTSYKDIGGYPGINSGDDFRKEIQKDDLIFHAIDTDPDDDADAITMGKKTNFGFKLIGLATDGGREAKVEVLRKRSEELKKSGYYAEVSGKIAEIFIKKFGVGWISEQEQVKEILHPKEIIWFGLHPTEAKDYPADCNGWYGRKIGGKFHHKIMVGKPKV